MAERPSRAKMCNWVSGELRKIQLSPSNPADIRAILRLKAVAEPKLRAIADIAAELGWHADASLDTAWEWIQQYETEFAPVTPTENGENTHE